MTTSPNELRGTNLSYQNNSIRVFPGHPWNQCDWMSPVNQQHLRRTLPFGGVRNIFVPRPFKMNGRVISVDEWNALDGVKIRTLRRTNVHYGAEVDGICFPLADALTPASTIAMVTADCPTVVIAGYGVTGDARVIVCHCGRDSLHDLENKHAGITAITSIAEWVNTGNILYAGIFAGIGGNSFTHPTCHPRHGEKNQKMRAFFGRYASEGVRELSNYNISFDMPVIVKHLLMRLGVNERVIHLDGVNTATHVPYASFAKGDRGKPQRNIIYVHPFQLFEAVA